MPLKDAQLRIAELEQQVAHLTNWITGLVNQQFAAAGAGRSGLLPHLPTSAFSHPALIAQIAGVEPADAGAGDEHDPPSVPQPATSVAPPPPNVQASVPLVADTEPAQA